VESTVKGKLLPCGFTSENPNLPGHASRSAIAKT
jgi:hypothetical protein